MDRAMKNLLARVSGAFALGAFFVHVGQHLTRAYATATVPSLGWVVVAVLLVAGVAAAWAQARLNAKRAALWTAAALLGVGPMALFLWHRAPLSEVGGYGIVLLLNLVFGGATLAFTSWLLAEPIGQPPRSND